MSTKTIDEVLADLNAIVDRSVQTGARIGYFSALYCRVTSNVRRAILAGNVFEDGPRMSRFDVVFASRFLDAWRGWQSGDRISLAWQVPFRVLDAPEALVIQHLILGMNAHIGLDLGVAAAEIGGTPEGLHALRDDFMKINQVLARLVNVVQADLGIVSPLLGKLDRIAPELQDKVFDFGMDAARDAAWLLAEQLVHAAPGARPAIIAERDADVTALAHEIYPARGVLEPVVWMIREAESKDIRFNIQVVAS